MIEDHTQNIEPRDDVGRQIRQQRIEARRNNIRMIAAAIGLILGAIGAAFVSGHHSFANFGLAAKIDWQRMNGISAHKSQEGLK